MSIPVKISILMAFSLLPGAEALLATSFMQRHASTVMASATSLCTAKFLHTSVKSWRKQGKLPWKSKSYWANGLAIPLGAYLTYTLWSNNQQKGAAAAVQQNKPVVNVQPDVRGLREQIEIAYEQKNVREVVRLLADPRLEEAAVARFILKLLESHTDFDYAVLEQLPARCMSVLLYPYIDKCIYPPPSGQSVLHLIADRCGIFNKDKILRVWRALISRSDVVVLNSRNGYKKQSLLHKNILMIHVDFLQELLRHQDIDVNLKDDAGNTPLLRYTACSDSRYVPCAKLLLQHGADPFIKNNAGESFASRIKTLKEKHDKITELMLRERAESQTEIIEKALIKVYEEHCQQLTEAITANTPAGFSTAPLGKLVAGYLVGPADPELPRVPADGMEHKE